MTRPGFHVMLRVGPGAALCALALASSLGAQVAKPEPGALERQVLAARAALRSADAKPIAEVLRDDGLFYAPTGQLLGRQAYAAYLAGVTGHTGPAADADIGVHPIPGATLITGQIAPVADEATRKGAPGRRFTEVWVPAGGAVRLVSRQETVIGGAVPAELAPADPGGGRDVAAPSDRAGGQPLVAAWERLARAVAEHDAARYEALTTPGLTLALPGGEIQTREQRVKELEARKGQPPGVPSPMDDARTVVIGDVGLLFYRVPGATPLRIGTVWVKLDGAWRQAAAQVTRIAASAR